MFAFCVCLCNVYVVCSLLIVDALLLQHPPNQAHPVNRLHINIDFQLLFFTSTIALVQKNNTRHLIYQIQISMRQARQKKRRLETIEEYCKSQLLYAQLINECVIIPQQPMVRLSCYYTTYATSCTRQTLSATTSTANASNDQRRALLLFFLANLRQLLYRINSTLD